MEHLKDAKKHKTPLAVINNIVSTEKNNFKLSNNELEAYSKTNPKYFWSFINSKRKPPNAVEALKTYNILD